jgi:hypothetical protein
MRIIALKLFSHSVILVTEVYCQCSFTFYWKACPFVTELMSILGAFEEEISCDILLSCS